MIVVDASTAAKWLFPEEHSQKASELATATLVAQERIVAPSLFWIEIANILRQRMRRADLTLTHALNLFERFQEIPIMSHSPSGLSLRALTLADQYRRPAVCGAHYVALAEILGVNLWTDDQRLLRTLNGKLPFVKWIGDYQGGKPY